MKTVDKILTDIIYECYRKCCDGQGTTGCLSCSVLQQAKQQLVEMIMDAIDSTWGERKGKFKLILKEQLMEHLTKLGLNIK